MKISFISLVIVAIFLIMTGVDAQARDKSKNTSHDISRDHMKMVEERRKYKEELKRLK